MLLFALLLSRPAFAQDSAASQPDLEQSEQLADDALTQIEGLEQPDAIVSGNTITITGVADDAAIKEEAANAVIAATGHDTIDNKIELSLDVQDRTRGAANRVSQRLQAWIAYLPVIPIALVVLIVFMFFAWFVGKLRWPYARATRNLFLQDILRKLTQSAVLLAGVLLALEILDAMALVGGVLGAAGVAGIAIGFAFKDLIENYIASILLSLRQPFRPQDHVVIDGHEGLVTAMNARTTVLTTFDGNVVRIPNALVFKTTLINYTSDNRRRFTLNVGVGYDVNLPQAIDVGVQTLLDTPGVLREPEPMAIVTNLGDSSITVQLFGWVDQSQADYYTVRSNAMQNVKAQYDVFNIDMPEPIYKIRIESDSRIFEGTRVPPRAPAQPASGADQTARGDISKDSTIAQMSQQAAREQGEDNLLSSDAPPE